MDFSLVKRIIKKRVSERNPWIVRILLAILWGSTLGLLVWIGWKNRALIFPYLQQADYSRLPYVFLSYLISLASAIFGWAAIMRSLDNSLTWWIDTQIYCLTLAARRLPGTFWYVGGRMALYKRLNVPQKTVVIASSIELVAVLASGGLIGFMIMLLLGINLPSLIVLLIVLGSIAGILLLHPLALKALVRKEDEGGKPLSFKNILSWFVIYTITWITGGIMLVQLVTVFQPIMLREAVFMIGAWAISGAAGLLTFFLPSSFGVTEVTLAALLSQVMPLPLAGVISILTRLTTIIFEVLLSVAFYPIFKNRLLGNDHPERENIS